MAVQIQTTMKTYINTYSIIGLEWQGLLVRWSPVQRENLISGVDSTLTCNRRLETQRHGVAWHAGAQRDLLIASM